MVAKRFISRVSHFVIKIFMTLHVPVTTTGFTLIEIVIALGILSIGILGVLSLFPVGLDAQKRSFDYSNAANLAQWQMTVILYESHLTGTANSLTADTSYPTTNPDPEPFSENLKYLWHYDVSQPYAATLSTFYRVDLYIYSVEDTNNPIEKVVNYIELPE